MPLQEQESMENSTTTTTTTTTTTVFSSSADHAGQDEDEKQVHETEEDATTLALASSSTSLEVTEKHSMSNEEEQQETSSTSNSNSHFITDWIQEKIGIEPTPEIIAIVTIYFVEGALGLARLAQTYLLKDELSLGPAELAALTGIFALPWTIKPLYGFLSDGFPLFGYKRKSYLVVAGLLGATSYAVLSWSGFWQGLETGKYIVVTTIWHACGVSCFCTRHYTRTLTCTAFFRFELSLYI
jgi:hypothetical protein